MWELSCAERVRLSYHETFILRIIVVGVRVQLKPELYSGGGFSLNEVQQFFYVKPAFSSRTVKSLTLERKVLDFFIATPLSLTVSEQHHFTSWQTTGKNDDWRSAYCGLQLVSPVAFIPIARPAICLPTGADGILTLIEAGTCQLIPCSPIKVAFSPLQRCNRQNLWLLADK